MKIRLIYECLQSEETSVLFCIHMKSTLTFLIVLLRVIVNESFDLFPFIIKYLSSLIYIIVDILCTFEDDTCGWEISTTDPDEKFKWIDGSRSELNIWSTEKTILELKEMTESCSSFLVKPDIFSWIDLNFKPYPSHLLSMPFTDE